MPASNGPGKKEPFIPRRPSAERDAPGLHTIGTLTTGFISVQKFTRDDGEVVWRNAQNRLVLPLTGADAREVTIQLEGGPTRTFVWNNSLGFFPAGTLARIVTTPATSLQLLWTPDPHTAGSVEPLLPFDDPFVAINAHAIAQELDGETPDRLLVESIGNAIVIKLMRRFGTHATDGVPRGSGLSRERLRRIVEYIDAHLGDDLTLNAIADVACLSPYHLSRSFHRATGLGLHRYVVQRRMDRAKHLVLRSNMSMAEIALNVGFESQAAFTTRFRQEVGLPPARLRRGG